MATLEKLAIANDDYKGAAKMSGALVRRNEILSFGLNTKKTHPLMFKYRKNEESIYLHAEIDAIKNALKLMSVNDIRGTDLYVCRVKKSKPRSGVWIWGLAKPCIGCTRALIHFGIRNVYYTTDTGSIEHINY